MFLLDSRLRLFSFKALTAVRIIYAHCSVRRTRYWVGAFF